MNTVQNAYKANMYFKQVIVPENNDMTEKKRACINDAHLVADPHGLIHSFEPTKQRQPWKLLALRMFGKGYAPRTVLGRLRSWGYKTPRATQTIKNWKTTVENATGLEFRTISKVATGSALYTGRPEVGYAQQHDTERANTHLNHIDPDEYDRHTAQVRTVSLWAWFNSIIEE
jgi:hypothetical protein